MPHARPLTLALSLASLASLLLASATVRADIPPQPYYVAGLWFYAGHHYGPNGPMMDSVRLMGCQPNSANCRTAQAAKVVGDVVLSVGGKVGADPNSVFGKPGAPDPVVVVFQSASGQPVTVKFAPR